MQRHFRLVILYIWTIAACNNRQENREMEAIARSLSKSNESIAFQNDQMYETMEKKARSLRQRTVALMWMPKTRRVKEQSVNLCTFIDKLQQQVQLAGTDSKNVDRLLNETVDSLYKKWVAYRQNIPLIDTAELAGRAYIIRAVSREVALIEKRIAGIMKLDNDSTSTVVDNARKWNARLFQDATPLQASMLLYKLKNDALSIENIMLKYINDRAYDLYICGYSAGNSFVGIINTGYCKAGQTIEISAGVGSISEEASPGVTINDSTLVLKPDGTATYSFFAKGKPGKHTIPVQIVYYKPDGSKATVVKTLEYIIAE